MTRFQGWPGPVAWLVAGTMIGVSILLMASVGLVLIPLLLPLTVLVYVLLEVGVIGRPWLLGGLILAIDLFALSLVLDPPCAAPLIVRVEDGTFRSECLQADNMTGLMILTILGSAAIGGLAWALVKRRPSRRGGAGAGG